MLANYISKKRALINYLKYSLGKQYVIITQIDPEIFHDGSRVESTANYNESLTNDLSIGSTETKYIKLNTKTQKIYCFVNENLTTFLYTLSGGTRKHKDKKRVFYFKVYTKVKGY